MSWTARPVSLPVPAQRPAARTRPSRERPVSLPVLVQRPPASFSIVAVTARQPSGPGAAVCSAIPPFRLDWLGHVLSKVLVLWLKVVPVQHVARLHRVRITRCGEGQM